MEFKPFSNLSCICCNKELISNGPYLICFCGKTQVFNHYHTNHIVHLYTISYPYNFKHITYAISNLKLDNKIIEEELEVTLSGGSIHTFERKSLDINLDKFTELITNNKLISYCNNRLNLM